MKTLTIRRWIVVNCDETATVTVPDDFDIDAPDVSDLIDEGLNDGTIDIQTIEDGTKWYEIEDGGEWEILR